MVKKRLQSHPSRLITPRVIAPVPVAGFGVALAAFQRGALDQAQAICRETLAKDPDDFESLHLLGVMAYQIGDYALATSLLKRSLEINHQSAQAYNNLGLVCHSLGQLDEAIVCFEESIRLDGQFTQAYSNRSLTRFALKRYKDAVADCDAAIAIDANYAEAYNNRAHALLCLHRHQEAIADLKVAIRIKPAYEAAYYNLGVAYHELQQTEQALFHYEKTLQLNPNHVLTYWNVALLSLLMGDYSVGWELHEWRFKQKNFQRNLRDCGRPLWLGDQALQGKTILLYAEQGLGDTLQFCRYAPLVADLGAKVILAVQSSLVQVLQCLPGAITVVAAGDQLSAFDFHCPLMSLPLAFKTTLASVPMAESYLRADSQKAKKWARRLSAYGDKKRIGLVWSGGFRADQPEVWNINERRNIALDLVAQLNCPELLFVSLQKGNPAEAELLDRKQEVWPTDNLLNFTDDIVNFSDTAALIDNLDLVVSVDTSTAHLAAAMGKPVWLLNRYDTCWRWLLQGERSPWYTSVRIYRQQQFADWGNVIELVRRDLANLNEETLLS